MEKNTKNYKGWYEEIGDKFDQLQAKYDFPEDISHEIREFVFQVAKDQYNTGNRSGIRWLHDQMRKEKLKTSTVHLQPIPA